jgi:hypothetical protein
MSKILKNTTGTDIELDIGLLVPANSSITINPADFDEAASSDNIIEFIGNGNIIVNDGSKDLSKADGSRLIQGIFPSTVGIIGPAGSDGEPGPSGFGVYAFSNTQADGTILKGRGVTINKTGTGTYQYGFTTTTPDTNYIVTASFFNIGTNTDTNYFVDNKTINGFTLTMGVGDNGTTPDTLQDFNHSVVILGDAGPQGITSAYEAWLNVGNTGTEQDFLDTLVSTVPGPQGPQGPAGDSQIRVSPNDSTIGFIEDKFVAENNKVSITVLNDGSDEDIQIGINPSNIGTSELNNDANFINASQAPVQTSDIADFETSLELNNRDNANRNRANHTGTQTASTISDFVTSVKNAETTTSLSFNPVNNILTFINEEGMTENIDLSLFLDDTNLAQIVSGTLDGGSGIATFTRDDSSTFTVDFSALNDQSFINNAISTHEQTIDNHNDVDLTGLAVGSLLKYDGNNFVPFIDYKVYITDDVPLGTLSNSFQQRLRLNYNIPVAGEYEVSLSYRWSLDSTSTDMESRLQLNDTDTIFEQKEEARDSGGSGITVNLVEGGTSNSGTSQRYNSHYSEVISLPVGTGFIDLDFASEVNGVDAVIYKATISLKRFS